MSDKKTFGHFCNINLPEEGSGLSQVNQVWQGTKAQLQLILIIIT